MTISMLIISSEMKGGIGWKLITLALLSDVPVSRNWY